MCTFTVDGVNVGLIICYDFRFPELSRALVKEGKADVIIMPAAFPKDEASPSWHPFVQTRAIENQVYMMSLSRAGSFFGRSIVCPPWLFPEDSKSPAAFKPTVLGDDAGVLPLVVNKAVLTAVRKEFALLKDMHPLLGRSRL